MSTLINPPSLGSNGLHCVEFPGEKRLLNLNLGELPALLETSCCLVCGRLHKPVAGGVESVNWSGYMIFLCAEGIFVLRYSLVDLLLLDRRCLGRGCSGCNILLFTL